MYEYFLLSHIKPNKFSDLTYGQKTERVLNISSLISGISVFNSVRPNTSFYGNIVDVTNEGVIKVQTEYGVMEFASDLILFQTGMQLQFLAKKSQGFWLLELMSINNTIAREFINEQILQDYYGISNKDLNVENSDKIVLSLGDIKFTDAPKVRQDTILFQENVNNTRFGVINNIDLSKMQIVIPENQKQDVIQEILFDIAKNTDVSELISIMVSNPDNKDIKKMANILRNFINVQVKFDIELQNIDLDYHDAVDGVKPVDNDFTPLINSNNTKSPSSLKVEKEIHANIIKTTNIHDESVQKNIPEKSDIEQNNTKSNNVKDDLKILKKPEIFELNVTNKNTNIKTDIVFEGKINKNNIITPLGIIDSEVVTIAKNYEKNDILHIKLNEISISVLEKPVSEKFNILQLTDGFNNITDYINKNSNYNSINNNDENFRYNKSIDSLTHLILNIPRLDKKQSIASQVNKFIREIKLFDFDISLPKKAENPEINNIIKHINDSSIIEDLINIKTAILTQSSDENKNEWSLIPIPLIVDNKTINLNFYVKNEYEDQQNKQDSNRKSQFKIEVKDTVFGAITFDGNCSKRNSKSFLDLNMYISGFVEKSVTDAIRQVFNNTMELLDCDGRIKIFSKKTIADNPKSFIKNLLNNFKV